MCRPSMYDTQCLVYRSVLLPVYVYLLGFVVAHVSMDTALPVSRYVMLFLIPRISFDGAMDELYQTSAPELATTTNDYMYAVLHHFSSGFWF